MAVYREEYRAHLTLRWRDGMLTDLDVNLPRSRPASILTAAVSVASLVLIPCRPTVQDVQYLTATTDIVALHQKPAAVVLNRGRPG